MYVCVCVCVYVCVCACVLSAEASEQLLPWILRHESASGELFIEDIATSSQSLQIIAHHQPGLIIFVWSHVYKQSCMIMFVCLYHRVQNRTNGTHSESIFNDTVAKVENNITLGLKKYCKTKNCDLVLTLHYITQNNGFQLIFGRSMHSH